MHTLQTQSHNRILTLEYIATTISHTKAQPASHQLTIISQTNHNNTTITTQAQAFIPTPNATTTHSHSISFFFTKTVPYWEHSLTHLLYTPIMGWLAGRGHSFEATHIRRLSYAPSVQWETCDSSVGGYVDAHRSFDWCCFQKRLLQQFELPTCTYTNVTITNHTWMQDSQHQPSHPSTARRT